MAEERVAVVTIRLTPAERETAGKLASGMGVSISDVFRLALRLYAEQSHGQKKRAPRAR